MINIVDRGEIRLDSLGITFVDCDLNLFDAIDSLVAMSILLVSEQQKQHERSWKLVGSLS